MLVREIMTSPAYSVPVGASLEAALRMMATVRVSSLPVVDDGGCVVGIISEADVLEAGMAPDPRAHMRPVSPQSRALPGTVAEVMTADPYTVREDNDVADLALVFARKGWKSVPVIRGEALLGVVSRSDLIRAMARPDIEIAEEIATAFGEIGLKTWHADVFAGVAHITGTASERERAAATSIVQSVRGVRRVTLHESDA
jgi:CBS domain-containing protein